MPLRREVPLTRVITVTGFFLILTACGRPFFTPPSTLADFEPDDPRYAVVGRWTIEFVRGDSIARGTLVFTDSVGSPVKRTLKGRLAVDLTPILGGPMGCLESGRASHSVVRTDTTLEIWFEARTTHCWLGVSTRWYGDSAIGEWTRPTQIVGGLRSGPFRMWREEE